MVRLRRRRIEPVPEPKTYDPDNLWGNVPQVGEIEEARDRHPASKGKTDDRDR